MRVLSTFALFCAALLGSAVVPAMGATGNILVFVDFSSTQLSITKFNSSLYSYASSFGANHTISVKDTQGDVLTALIALQASLTVDNTVNMIVVADNEAVTQSIQGIVARNVLWSNILFVSALSSSTTVCDPVANPSTICIIPTDLTYLTGLFSISRDMLNWASVAVILSNNEYGRAIEGLLDKVTRNVPTAATIVSRQFLPMGSQISDAADDAVLATSIQGRPVAVMLFVSPKEYERVVKAQARNPSAANLFFLLSKTNVNQVKTFTGTVGSTLKGAVFTPYYSSASSLGLLSSETDEFGRLLLSYLHDALLVASAADALTPAAIFNRTYSTIQPMTTSESTLAFDAPSGRRTSLQLNLNSNSYNMNPSLTTFILRPGSSTPLYDGNTNIKTLVPASPLRAVTVCMAAPPHCADVANLARLLAYTLQMNEEASTGTSIVPIAINTGLDGVSGLSSFIQVSKQCSILTGPGRFHINNVFTPIINNYGITQIDYTTGNPALSDSVTYPYFNRAVPSDVFNLKVLAAALDFFAWERVIVLTTSGAYGNAMASAVRNAMEERAVMIEQLVQIESTTRANLVPFFTLLRDKYIGRVVIPILPVTDEEAALFLDTWNSMNDKTTIFLFSHIFCQYLDNHPEQRARIPSSICSVPKYDDAVVNATVPSFKTLLPRVRTALTSGGFDTIEECNLETWNPFSSFALDTAKMLRQIVTNATVSNVVINTTNMMPMIRGVTFNGVSGTFSITPLGDRTSAEYTMTIQELNGNVTTFGFWNSHSTPNFKFLLPNKNSIRWLDGGNTIPSATIRSLGFIAESTLTASPATIVLSVLGFLTTFLVFGFCYRHYLRQRLLEQELDRMEMEYETAAKVRENVA